MDALNQAAHHLSETLYKQSASQQSQGQSNANTSENVNGASKEPKDDVIDAEYSVDE